MKNRTIVILSIIICLFVSCQNKSNNCVGNYKNDKFILRDTSDTLYDYDIEMLTLKADNAFTLKKYNGQLLIEGSWKIVKTHRNNYTICFEYSDKKILGTLKGTIITFRYPNEFHNGIYEQILYVKQIR